MTNDLSGFSVAADDQNTLPVNGVAQVGQDTLVVEEPQSNGNGVVPGNGSVGQRAADEPLNGSNNQGNKPPMQYGGMAKEQLETLPSSDGDAENVPLVEVRENEPIPEEVSSWMEKLEKGEDIQLPQPISDDDGVLVSSANPQVTDDMIVLPMTQEQVEKGLQEQVFSGARWLAEWCVRLVKKFHGQVVYRQSQGGGDHGPN